ncbi:MAG: cyclic di-GMP phosphodiesterase [Verrucomicrobiota bacterium]|jgi:putative two-component system response regulator
MQSSLTTPESNARTQNGWHGDTRTFGKMKILIVDDEPSNVALLEDILSDAGYKQLRSVTDSRLALETCYAFAPDLILLDLMMPHVDGFSILHSLRSAGDDVFLPVIVLTADANEETKRAALGAGATDFLLKPLDFLEVLLRIANLLEMRRLHIQLDTQRAALEDALRERSLELREAHLHLENARA